MLFRSHERLRDPQPSDIKEGLQPVPPMDDDLAATAPAFATVKTASGREVINVGVNGGFVDAGDFRDWVEYLESYIFEDDLEMKIELNATAVDWAIGMLWPDQSYVSMKSFRGSSKKASWGPYHLARVEMLAGDYNFKIILLFSNFFSL